MDKYGVYVWAAYGAAAVTLAAIVYWLLSARREALKKAQESAKRGED